ncbi:MAG: DUF4129 domain-containing protein [Chloroflexi bacterium]|nr:DUF4129 domain-containing protein [Chloroflexota bacterium]
MFLLAISLPNVQLLPGRPFSLGEVALGPLETGGSESLPGGNIALLVVRIALGLMVILLPITLIALVRSPDLRRRFLANVLILAVFLLIANLFIGSMENEPAEREVESSLAKEPTAEPYTPGPVDVYTPTDIPDWVVTAISVAAAGTLCVTVIAIVWFVRRRRQKQPTALEQLAEEAQGAIDAIHSGGELRETVLRCYRDMSRVLREERGLQRGTTMTAREFETSLRSTGIPAEPVQQLTRLFEQVRYGHERLGPQEEALAINSLSAIITACQPRPSV